MYSLPERKSVCLTFRHPDHLEQSAGNRPRRNVAQPLVVDSGSYPLSDQTSFSPHQSDIADNILASKATAGLLSSPASCERLLLSDMAYVLPFGEAVHYQKGCCCKC